MPFHTVYVFLTARIQEWFSIPFSSGPPFVRILCYELSVLFGPALQGLFFIELCKPLHHDKAVIHEVILKVSPEINKIEDREMKLKLFFKEQ